MEMREVLQKQNESSSLRHCHTTVDVLNNKQVAGIYHQGLLKSLWQMWPQCHNGENPWIGNKLLERRIYNSNKKTQFVLYNAISDAFLVINLRSLWKCTCSSTVSHSHVRYKNRPQFRIIPCRWCQNKYENPISRRHWKTKLGNQWSLYSGPLMIICCLMEVSFNHFVMREVTKHRTQTSSYYRGKKKIIRSKKSLCLTTLPLVNTTENRCLF